MRVFKILITAVAALVAVFAGLLTAAAIALGGIVILLARRLLRGPTSAAPRSHLRRRGETANDVIDVTATEVPIDRQPVDRQVK